MNLNDKKPEQMKLSEIDSSEMNSSEIKTKQMNDKEAMEYIESLQGLGSVPGLDSIIHLCDKLNNPQDELSFIHVAGTNGKGSITAYLSSVLKEAGYRIGRYNSPTIRDYRERISVNAVMIPKTALARLLSKIKSACEELVAEGRPQPTSFEVETALAFLYFKEKKCDYVILEVGMGGELDATNLIKNTEIAVLTSISMDHMGFLGNTLEEIAKAKAGIIKPGCHVVSTQQTECVTDVIKKICKEKHTSLTIADTEALSDIHYGVEKQRFKYRNQMTVTISLAGKWQIENALLALTILDVLKERGLKISEKAVLKGMEKTRWPGRFEVLTRKPYFIVDGAHNEDAARKLAWSIQFYFTNKKIIYIMGILKDKEYEKIIQLTSPFADSIITVKTVGNPRAMDAYQLASEVSRYHKNVTAADSIEEAVEMSYLLADKDSVIIAFGSLSYLGAVMDVMEKREKKV